VAVIASMLFYGQLSYLLWVYGQIQMTYVRKDATAEDLNEWLLVTEARNAWLHYRVGLISITVSIAAYAYAILTTLIPAFATAVKWSLSLPLGVIALYLAAHWYFSWRDPRADEPVREWLEAYMPRWFRPTRIE
jgi:hypothetical protein